MRLTVDISDKEIQSSIDRALKAKNRRLSIRNWVIRDLTCALFGVNHESKWGWVEYDRHAPAIAAVLGKRLDAPVAEAEKLEAENKLIARLPEGYVTVRDNVTGTLHAINPDRFDEVVHGGCAYCGLSVHKKGVCKEPATGWLKPINLIKEGVRDDGFRQ